MGQNIDKGWVQIQENNIFWTIGLLNHSKNGHPSQTQVTYMCVLSPKFDIVYWA